MKNHVIWRDAVPGDLARIRELWDEQEKRFTGTNVRVDRPQLFWESEEGIRPQATGPRENLGSEEGNRLQAIHGQPGPPAGDREKQVPTAPAEQNLESHSRPAGWRYKPPIMRLRVAEKDGKVVGFRYVEAVPEVCLVTGDEDVMKTLAKELTEECHLFKSLGFRSGWGLVPEKFAQALGRFTRYSPVRLWKGLRLIGCDFSELGD